MDPRRLDQGEIGQWSRNMNVFIARFFLFIGCNMYCQKLYGQRRVSTNFSFLIAAVWAPLQNLDNNGLSLFQLSKFDIFKLLSLLGFCPFITNPCKNETCYFYIQSLTFFPLDLILNLTIAYVFQSDKLKYQNLYHKNIFFTKVLNVKYHGLISKK